MSFLILLCQCSLPVPTLLLLPSSPPRAVLLPILPSHCVVCCVFVYFIILTVILEVKKMLSFQANGTGSPVLVGACGQ